MKNQVTIEMLKSLKNKMESHNVAGFPLRYETVSASGRVIHRVQKEMR